MTRSVTGPTATGGQDTEACLEVHGTGLEGHRGLVASRTANEQVLGREAASVELPSPPSPPSPLPPRVLPGFWLRAAGGLRLTDSGSESRLWIPFMRATAETNVNS